MPTEEKEMLQIWVGRLTGPQNREKRKAVEWGYKPITISAISPRLCKIASYGFLHVF